MPPDHVPRTPRAGGARRPVDRNIPQFGCAGTPVVHHVSVTLSLSGFVALLVLGVLLVSPVAVDPVAAGILLSAAPAAGGFRMRYRHRRVT